jgi:hypothetical protein
VADDDLEYLMFHQLFIDLLNVSPIIPIIITQYLLAVVWVAFIRTFLPPIITLVEHLLFHHIEIEIGQIKFTVRFRMV